ncbi:MAG TPA: hypothetical protein VGN72_04990 [Tepidisphaeraceae bacterium]|jgi:hypothetical protein|nr:hypothetical protein [Tepidisphaeraceae bacterium]
MVQLTAQEHARLTAIERAARRVVVAHVESARNGAQEKADAFNLAWNELKTHLAKPRMAGPSR